MSRWYVLAILVLLLSCNSRDAGPDVSHVPVTVSVQRFEQDFFRIDTNNIGAGLDRLQQSYPTFLPIYLQYVLGLDKTSNVEEQLRFFLSQSRPLYDSVLRKHGNFDATKESFATAFRHVKHYYPQYREPRIITLLGPVDALAKLGESYTPNFLGPDFLAVSLQFYLGKQFSLYQDQGYIMNVAPLFRSRRFDTEYIVPEAMRLVADDLYPDSSAGSPLIEQIVEKGKQWYLLDHFLPAAHDSLKTGYTGQQLEWCAENEGNIWSHIVKNEGNLYTIEPHVIQNYLGEAPFTQNMPESSPGNIGQWIGWRIVQKFASRNEQMTLQQVLQTPARTLFEGAGYRPK